MTRLPCDVSRCVTGSTCPLRDRCRRWLDKGEGCYRLVASAFPPGEDCYAFMPIREENK